MIHCPRMSGWVMFWPWAVSSGTAFSLPLIGGQTFSSSLTSLILGDSHSLVSNPPPVGWWIVHGIAIPNATVFELTDVWAHGHTSQVCSWLLFHIIVQLVRSPNFLLWHNDTVAIKCCWLFCCVCELLVVHCSGNIIHKVNNLNGISKGVRGPYTCHKTALKSTKYDCSKVCSDGVK